MIYQIDDDDVDFVRKIKGVNEILGMYFEAGELELDKQKRYTYVIGLDTDKIHFIEEGFITPILEGRQLKKGDLNKVVLGYNYQFEDKIFEKAVKLGDKININGNPYEVVGFYDEIGNPQDDSQSYITNEAFETLYPDKKDEFGFVMLSAQKDINPSELAEKIQEKLRKHKNQDEGKEDFFVQ